MPDNSRMSENGATNEHGPQRDDASGGLSGELLSSGSGGSGGDMPAPGSSDMLSSGPIERPRRNLTAIVISLVAVLAVIGGGVAYVGYHKLASSGAQPDKWVPASAIAYVKIDLDPAAAEKIGALRFEQKFPDAPHVTSADQLKDALLSAAFDQPSSSINYATDIKPWLGDRVAVAVYPDANGKPQPVGILQVKDATKAQAGLTQLIHTAAGDSNASAPGFAIEGDYAVVGPSQAAVTAAVAAAQTSNITASNSYTSDIATLGGERIMTAWADLGAVVKYASKAASADLGGLSNPSTLGQLSQLGGASSLAPLAGLAQLNGAQGLTSQLKGRFVLGLSLQAGYASISGRLIGANDAGLSNGGAGLLLAQLPSGSVAGVAVSGLGPVISKEITALEAGSLQALGVKKQLDAIGTKLGISLPGDVINLLGGDVAAGLDNVPAGAADVKFTAITQPTDAAQGLKTAQVLTGLLTSAGTPATATASGSNVVITNDAAASGALGNNDGFKSAMAGMPDQVVAAAYINLAGIWPALGSKVPSDLQHLTGIGTYEALDGTDVTFSVRVTVN
jgi:hypothetical protein